MAIMDCSAIRSNKRIAFCCNTREGGRTKARKKEEGVQWTPPNLQGPTGQFRSPEWTLREERAALCSAGYLPQRNRGSSCHRLDSGRTHGCTRWWHDTRECGELLRRVQQGRLGGGSGKNNILKEGKRAGNNATLDMMHIAHPTLAPCTLYSPLPVPCSAPDFSACSTLRRAQPTRSTAEVCYVSEQVKATEVKREVREVGRAKCSLFVHVLGLPSVAVTGTAVILRPVDSNF
ncbi:hypothetical protein C8F04DRAFT_1198083 [Mycena alexandri]|uniref:Uncharacterized protein n=1 Tax=Mycena alexandri TaxID=1745969 RepID=A0AAD6S1G9_9AGAR|nr:hypothetical protein C8F04DRAFT_1198083 [Mycena alexandri]